MNNLDTALLVLRLLVGVTMMLHGYNHMLGPGGVEGTSRWFAAIGLRPPKVHATLSGIGEMASGVALAVGLFTPVAAAFVVGTMVVAGITVHRKNGFFVFKEGYEYVVVLGVVSAVIGLLGAGAASVDHLLGWDTTLQGAVGVGIAAGGGVLGAMVLLAACWRPSQPTTSD